MGNIINSKYIFKYWFENNNEYIDNSTAWIKTCFKDSSAVKVFLLLDIIGANDYTLIYKHIQAKILEIYELAFFIITSTSSKTSRKCYVDGRKQYYNCQYKELD